MRTQILGLISHCLICQYSAHFEHHERIELEEENKERAYQGLPPLEKLPEDHDQQPTSPEHQRTPLEDAAEEAAIKNADPNHVTPMDGQGHVVPEDDIPSNPRFVRQPKPNPDTLEILKAARDAKSKPGYGEGEDGYQRPKSKADKMRYAIFSTTCTSFCIHTTTSSRNLPYKVRVALDWALPRSELTACLDSISSDEAGETSKTIRNLSKRRPYLTPTLYIHDTSQCYLIGFEFTETNHPSLDRAISSTHDKCA